MIKIDKFLFGLIAAMSLHAFDDVAIVTMLPEVTRQLGGESWFGASFFSYLLASLVSLVWAGYLTDREGPRKPFIIGLVIFVFGLLVGAFAQNMPQFVAGRAFQGFGGGAIQAVVFSAINMAYDEKGRKRAISLLASAWILPALLAPMIAGYITETWDWHWVFLGMIPFAIVVCIGTQRQLGQLSRKPDTPTNDQTLILTTLRIAFGIGIFLAGLNWYTDSWIIFVVLPLGVVFFLKPLLGLFPKGILTAKPGLSAALALKGLLVYAVIGSEAFIPVFLSNVYDYSAFEAGSVVTSGAATWILATWLFEVYGDKFSTLAMLTSGTVTLFSGLVILIGVLLVLKIPYLVYSAWACVCFGMGMAYSIAIDQAMKHTDEGTEGATATGAGMVDAIGFSFASGIGGAVLNITALQAWPLNDSIQIIWIINACVALLAVFVSFLRFK